MPIALAELLTILARLLGIPLPLLGTQAACPRIRVRM
jgi:hypothetical protein